MKTLILHDLVPDDARRIIPNPSPDLTLYPALPAVRPCLGCFGCWLKTPGRCVIDDRASDFSALMAAHDRLIVISRMTFGGLSPDVKAVLDRSIGFILPFFHSVNGEMHHVQRYGKSPDLSYLFYGGDINEAEKETARALTQANALNFASQRQSAAFYPSIQEIGEVLA